MSILDALRKFSSTTVKVACPICAHVTEQNKNRLRENITIICPKCGLYFLPRDK
ncbi:YnfU family zinc-binding protein [Brenneria roseae]|uniref:YnfU family zinc-binding protein n=1 Tax=Brenneria roseae TaxID=1509241 RepID=UPI001FF9411A|nr:YnfU family zinc-binding protein [Brenneria roseae]